MKQNLIDPKKTALLCDFSHDETFTKIVELTAIPFPTSQWTPADVTTLDDIAKRLAAAGFIDNGSVEIRGLMISGSSQQAQLFVINRTKACHRYKIVLSDPLHTTMEFDAFITNWAPSNTVGDKARVAFNLSIDGDVKFYNDLGVIWDGMASGGGESPQINCEGAIDTVILSTYFNENFTIPVTGIEYIINGVTYTEDNVDSNGLVEILPNTLGSIKFKTLSDSNVRMMARFLPENNDQAYLEFSDNPTAGMNESNYVTVCFAPAEQNSISCEGAESAAVLGLFMAESRDPSNAPFSLKIDGVSMGENMTLDDIKSALSDAGISVETYYQLA